MTRHGDRLYLGTMLDAARTAQEFRGETTRAEFDRNDLLQLALAHLVQRVGRMADKVSAAGRASLPGIEWSLLTGDHSRIQQDVLNTDYDAVWDVAVDVLPHIVPPLEAVLAPEPPE